MPESKHRRKNRSHSAWRKARNNRRAQASAARVNEKRGMERALKVIREQVEDPLLGAVGLDPQPVVDKPKTDEGVVHDYYENQMGEK